MSYHLINKIEQFLPNADTISFPNGFPVLLHGDLNDENVLGK